MDEHREVGELILLVGSNPLPNYLAIRLLKPKSVSLVYSPETEQVKNYLRKVLKNIVSKVEDKCIEDATEPQAVRKVIKKCLGSNSNVHLHYTGGTKVMATHARLQFKEAGYEDTHASYLDERSGVLRFDNGYEIGLADKGLLFSINDVLALHGIERKTQNETPASAPTTKDTEKIAKAVMNAPKLAKHLYNIHKGENGKRKSLSKANEKPVYLPKIIKEELSVDQVPKKEWEKRTYDKWCDFLGGVWLEFWVGSKIQELLSSNCEIEIGVDCTRDNKRQLEVDIIVVRNHRLYLVSCTTETKIGLCKSKLFEAAMRARQLGGDLARSALVCLLHGSNDRGAYVEQLRSDVADIWNAPNTPRVFGLDDLKEWTGTNGDPDCKTLSEWLDS